MTEWLRFLWTETQSVPMLFGALEGVGLFVIGFAVTWNPYRNYGIPGTRVWWVIVLLYAALAWRYLWSAVIYAAPLREGLWPVAWTTCLVAGVVIGAKGAHDDNGGPVA